uniref:KASH domain-containing protein n=1 Tax=Eptatretus burgeri TaxID=7764 RepID=A0A8C4QTT5_EPTBU
MDSSTGVVTESVEYICRDHPFYEPRDRYARTGFSSIDNERKVDSREGFGCDAIKVSISDDLGRCRIAACNLSVHMPSTTNGTICNNQNCAIARFPKCTILQDSPQAYTHKSKSYANHEYDNRPRPCAELIDFCPWSNDTVPQAAKPHSTESDDCESHSGRRWGETGCREAMGNEEKERSKVAWESWPCNPALWEPTSKSLEENGTFAGLEMPTGDLASVRISSLNEQLLSSHFHGNGTLFSEKAKFLAQRLTAITTWLEQAREMSKRWDTPPSSVDQLEAYVEAYQDLKWQVENHSPEKDALIEEGRSFLTLFGSLSGLEAALKSLEVRWAGLLDLLSQQHIAVTQGLRLIKDELVAMAQTVPVKPLIPEGLPVGEDHLWIWDKSGQPSLPEDQAASKKSDCLAEDEEREHHESLWQFCTAWEELHNWLVDVEALHWERSSRMSEERRRQLLMVYSVEMSVWEAKKHQLCTQGNELSTKWPTLDANVRVKLQEVECKWEGVQKLLERETDSSKMALQAQGLTEFLSPGMMGLIAQLKERVCELKNWLGDAELLVFGGCLEQGHHVGKPTQAQLQDFQELCHQLRQRRSGMTAILQLCTHLQDGSRGEQVKEDLRPLSLNLVRRWEAIVLQAVQWQAHLQQSLDPQLELLQNVEPSLLNLSAHGNEALEWDNSDMMMELSRSFGTLLSPSGEGRCKTDGGWETIRNKLLWNGHSSDSGFSSYLSVSSPNSTNSFSFVQSEWESLRPGRPSSPTNLCAPSPKDQTKMTSEESSVGIRPSCDGESGVSSDDEQNTSLTAEKACLASDSSTSGSRDGSLEMKPSSHLARHALPKTPSRNFKSSWRQSDKSINYVVNHEEHQHHKLACAEPFCDNKSTNLKKTFIRSSGATDSPDRGVVHKMIKPARSRDHEQERCEECDPRQAITAVSTNMERRRFFNQSHFEQDDRSQNGRAEDMLLNVDFNSDSAMSLCIKNLSASLHDYTDTPDSGLLGDVSSCLSLLLRGDDTENIFPSSDLTSTSEYGLCEIDDSTSTSGSWEGSNSSEDSSDDDEEIEKFDKEEDDKKLSKTGTLTENVTQTDKANSSHPNGQGSWHAHDEERLKGIPDANVFDLSSSSALPQTKNSQNEGNMNQSMSRCSVLRNKMEDLHGIVEGNSAAVELSSQTKKLLQPNEEHNGNEKGSKVSDWTSETKQVSPICTSMMQERSCLPTAQLPGTVARGRLEQDTSATKDFRRPRSMMPPSSSSQKMNSDSYSMLSSCERDNFERESENDDNVEQNFAWDCGNRLEVDAVDLDHGRPDVRELSKRETDRTIMDVGRTASHSDFGGGTFTQRSAGGSRLKLINENVQRRFEPISLATNEQAQKEKRTRERHFPETSVQNAQPSSEAASFTTEQPAGIAVHSHSRIPRAWRGHSTRSSACVFPYKLLSAKPKKSRFPITDEDKPDGCVVISDVLERAKLEELENPQMETFVKRSWRTMMGLQEWNELPASIRVRDIYSVEGNGGLSSGGRTIVEDEQNRSHSVSSKTKRATRGPRHEKGRGQWRVKAFRVWGIAWRTWLLLQLLFASAALLPLFVSPRPCSWPWLSLTSNIVLSFPQGPPPI